MVAPPKPPVKRPSYILYPQERHKIRGWKRAAAKQGYNSILSLWTEYINKNGKDALKVRIDILYSVPLTPEDIFYIKDLFYDYPIRSFFSLFKYDSVNEHLDFIGAI